MLLGVQGGLGRVSSQSNLLFSCFSSIPFQKFNTIWGYVDAWMGHPGSEPQDGLDLPKIASFHKASASPSVSVLPWQLRVPFGEKLIKLAFLEGFWVPQKFAVRIIFYLESSFIWKNKPNFWWGSATR